MSHRPKPPFRADHVGSFLRPKYLLDARDQCFNQKSISAEQLRAVEDKAISEIVSFQQDVGLQSITDGEFRRTYFHIDFMSAWAASRPTSRSLSYEPMAARNWRHR